MGLRMVAKLISCPILLVHDAPILFDPVPSVGFESVAEFPRTHVGQSVRHSSTGPSNVFVFRNLAAVVHENRRCAGYHIVRVAKPRSLRCVTYVVMVLTWPSWPTSAHSDRRWSVLTATVTATWTDSRAPEANNHPRRAGQPSHRRSDPYPSDRGNFAQPPANTPAAREARQQPQVCPHVQNQVAQDRSWAQIRYT